MAPHMDLFSFAVGSEQQIVTIVCFFSLESNYPKEYKRALTQSLIKLDTEMNSTHSLNV